MKTVLLSVLLGIAAFGQSTAAPPTHFDAASIRPSAPASMSDFAMRLDYSPGRIRAENVDLKTLIENAYGIEDFQLQAPSWLEHDRFNLTAEVQQPLGHDQMAALLKPFLVRQFGLVTHTTSKPVNIYALEKNGGGALTPATPRDDRSRGLALTSSGFVLHGSGTLNDLAGMFSHVLDRPVVDYTGIQGTYKYDLHFTLETHLNPALLQRIGAKQSVARAQGANVAPVGQRANPSAAPPPPNGSAASTGAGSGDGTQVQPVQSPSLFTALPKQYGLKLVPRKGPITILVIDRANQRPLGN